MLCCARATIPVYRNHEAGPKLEDAGLVIALQTLERYTAGTEKI
jgi:hypothetical protein